MRIFNINAVLRIVIVASIAGGLKGGIMAQAGDWSKYVRAETTSQFSLPFTSKLSIDAGLNGSVKLVRSATSDLTVTATSELWQSPDAPVKNRLDMIQTIRTAGSLIATNNNPQPQQPWGVSYEISVPSGVSIAVTTQNGSVSANSLDAPLSMRSQNGSISLVNISGNVNAYTVNGQIDARYPENTLSDSHFDLRTVNGRIRVAAPSRTLNSSTVQSEAGGVKGAPVSGAVTPDGPSKNVIKSQNGSIEISPL